MNEEMNIVPVFPAGDMKLAVEMTREIMNRGTELRAEYASIEPDGTSETAKKWTALKKVDAELKKVEDYLTQSALDQAEVSRILTQIAYERKQFKVLYTEKWEAHCAIRDKDVPPAPKHLYTFSILATDEAMMSIDKTIKKMQGKGVDMFHARLVANDKDIKTLEKFMEAE